MSFPALDLTGFTALEDSSKYSRDPIDPSIQTHMEGGVYLSRPRNTRDPGLVITTGFTDITKENFLKLEAFYKSVNGGSHQFDYLDPVTEETLIVRFLKPYKSRYVGMGNRQRFDVDQITLQTV